jgi:hypothetical protein
MIFGKKISTRGRKREARRWMEESDRICYRIVFRDGPPRAGVDAEGRTFTERSAESSRAARQMLDELRARDRILCAAVTEIMWADAQKLASMTFEERRAYQRRRFAKERRERLHAQRKDQSQE